MTRLTFLVFFFSLFSLLSFYYINLLYLYRKCTESVCVCVSTISSGNNVILPLQISTKCLVFRCRSFKQFQKFHSLLSWNVSSYLANIYFFVLFVIQNVFFCLSLLFWHCSNDINTQFAQKWVITLVLTHTHIHTSWVQ